MKTLLTSALLLALFMPAHAEGPPTPPADEVKKAAQAWVDSLPATGYAATLRAADGVSPLPAQPVNDHLFAFTEGPVYIGIGFGIAPKPDSTLKELQDNLKHVALDQVPVPGVKAGNWETRLQTPVSSFKDGVTLEKYENGVLTFRVKTEFFAAYGRRTDLILPADAGLPPDAYFQIRTPIKAELLIEGRLFPAP